MNKHAETVTNIHSEISAFLRENKDEAYQAFQSKLIPSIDPKTMVGVRTPRLRAFAKKLAKHPQVDAFLTALPHETFEENQLHAFVLGEQQDFDAYTEALQNFLPYIDNWATCDQLPVHILTKKPARTLCLVQNWIADERPYIVRFGIGVLLQEFLDERFAPQHMQWVANIPSKDYYVNMMRAWYVAEALAKQPKAALTLLESNKLDTWTHNKAIQKARESRRISREQKTYLKLLKR